MTIEGIEFYNEDGAVNWCLQTQIRLLEGNHVQLILCTYTSILNMHLMSRD